MSTDVAKSASQTQEAWAALGEQFADIGRRFREDYERVSTATAAGTDEARSSFEEAVAEVRAAVEGSAKAIGESLRDPKIREETTEAGSALFRAVGVTISELGQKLQAQAERGQSTA